MKVITTPGRRGESAAINLGANYATGEYLLFLEDDDVFQNDYLAQIRDEFRGLNTAHGYRFPRKIRDDPHAVSAQFSKHFPYNRT